MSATRRIAFGALAIGLLGAIVDGGPPAGVAGIGGASAAALPEFAIFGWVSPPPAAATPERYRELADAGFNLVLPALDDTGGYVPTRSQLDLAAPFGLRCLVWDPRFELLPQASDPVALLEEIASDYAGHPAVAGYFLGDEPFPDVFDLLALAHRELRTIDPAHPGWNNLIGRQYFADVSQHETYTRAYLDRVEPAVLCNDHYDFLYSGDRGQFIENVTLLNRLSRERGIPFWSIVQLTEHSIFRAPSQAMLRWQVAMLLAYGARGVGYFTYWTPPPDPRWNWQPGVIAYDGTRTAWYDFLAGFNPRVLAAGETLAGLAWSGALHAGSTPTGGVPFAPDVWVSGVQGRAALGRFARADGRRHLVVVNSDSLSAQAIRLALPGTRAVERLGAARGAWSPAPVVDEPGGVAVSVTLEAGDFALLRLEPDTGAGATTYLAAAPNPAPGACVLSFSVPLEGAALDILDVTGRRVWHRRVSGRASVTWRGEIDAGGRAPAGVYVARVDDGARTVSSRLVWLGR